MAIWEELQRALGEDVERRVRAVRDEAIAARAAQSAAEARFAVARARTLEAERARDSALRLAHALERRLSDTIANASQFAAWYQFPDASFDALLRAAAAALLGGAMREEIVGASAGATELTCGSSTLELDRSTSSAARAIHIACLEPLARSAPAQEAGAAEIDPLARRRLLVSIWEGGGQAGVLTETRIVGAEPLLPGAELARLASRLLEAAEPEPDAGWPLGTHATRVGEADVDELVAFLRTGERSRPVLVISADFDDRTAVDPDELAARLCGAAHVVSLARGASFLLTELVNPSLSVWGGQIRCYRPGFSVASPSLRHPRIDPRRFSAVDELDNRLLLLACELDRPSAALGGARKLARESLAREPRTNAAEDALADARRSAVDVQAVRDGAANGRNGARFEERSVEAMRARLQALERELDEHRRLASRRSSATASRESLRTVAEATELAIERSRHLRFSSKALRTAEDSPYRPPCDVYDALMLLDVLADEYVGGEIGAGLGERATQLGLVWRGGVSDAARNRHRDRYSCSYEGTKLKLGPHVVVANGTGAARNCRIYLHVGDGDGNVSRGIYVGHVGRHLPDTTTG